MTAPQITIIALISISLLLNAQSHGKPKEGNQSFWTALVSSIIIISVLYWGGFFN